MARLRQRERDRNRFQDTLPQLVTLGNVLPEAGMHRLQMRSLEESLYPELQIG